MTITISNLELWTHLGITKEERMSEQRILTNITLECEGCDACETDDIADTVNYEDVVKQIKKVAKANYKTLEKLGDEICSAILKNKKVKSISIKLTKHVLPGTKGITISITKP